MSRLPDAPAQIPRTDVLGIGISALTLDVATDEIGRRIHALDPGYVTVTGVHGVMESQGDPDLATIHNEAALVCPDGMPMVGVMALSREGLALPTPDGRPVHCMVLLGTSSEERDRHLLVLATLARTIGSDLDFQDQLFNASSAAHACELLHGEESEDFNYFLEEAT